MSHTHNDPRELVAYCPACVARVRADQENARWRDAPLRRCTFSFPAPDRTRAAFSADLRVPVGMDAWRVRDRYDEIISMQVHATLEPLNPANGGDFDHALRWLTCTIGPIVEDVRAEPTIDHPSLFA